MSMPSAARTAGRGAALRPIPLRDRQAPTRRSTGAGRGAGGASPANATRSRLAASVLQERRKRGPDRGTGNREGRGRKPERRRPAIVDWFNSAERAEALQAFQLAQTREEVVLEESKPFAWRDFDSVIEQLPEGHWAVSYVDNVVQSVEGNAGLSGGDKERIVNETLQTLSALSLEDGEDQGRFDDAE